MAANSVSAKEGVLTQQEVESARRLIEKIRKQGGQVANIEDWSAGVCAAADALSARHFLLPEYNVQIMESDLEDAQLEAEIIRNKQELKNRIKKEGAAKPDPDWDAGNYLETSSFDRYAFLERDELTGPQLIELVQKTNRIEHAERKHDLTNLSGRVMGFFAAGFSVPDTISRTQRKKIEESFQRKLYKVRTHDNEHRYSPLEERGTKQRRLIFFNMIEETLKGVIASESFSHLSVGDVYGLYSWVMSTYGRERVEERRRQVLAKIKQLSALGEMKNFEQWKVKVDRVKVDARNINLKIDDAHIKENIITSIRSSNNKALRQSLGDVQYEYRSKKMEEGARFVDWSLDLFLEKLRIRYSCFVSEDSQETGTPAKGSQHQDGAGTSSHKKSSKEAQLTKLQKEKAELEKKIFSLKGGKSGEKKSGLGVCVWFNEGGCKKDKCPFEHRKVSKEELMDLKEKVREIGALESWRRN